MMFPLPGPDVLAEAAQIINGERQDTYGDVHASFARIALMWAAYLDRPVNTLDVANLMILLKVSRTREQYHRDSYVDICGYAALAEKLRPSIIDAGAEGNNSTATPKGTPCPAGSS